MRDIIPRDRVTLSRCRNEKRERESSANLASAREQTDQEQTRGNTAERVKRPEPSTCGWTNRGYKESRTKSISVDREEDRQRGVDDNIVVVLVVVFVEVNRQIEISSYSFELGIYRCAGERDHGRNFRRDGRISGDRFRKCRRKRRVRQSRSCRLSWHQSTLTRQRKYRSKWSIPPWTP